MKIRIETEDDSIRVSVDTEYQVTVVTTKKPTLAEALEDAIHCFKVMQDATIDEMYRHGLIRIEAKGGTS